MVSHRIWFRGRVQGVGFRYTCSQIAMDHLVSGWVQNLPDGRVELHVEGEAEIVARYLEAVRAAFREQIIDEQLRPGEPEGGPRGIRIRY